MRWSRTYAACLVLAACAAPGGGGEGTGDEGTPAGGIDGDAGGDTAALADSGSGDGAEGDEADRGDDDGDRDGDPTARGDDDGDRDGDPAGPGGDPAGGDGEVEQELGTWAHPFVIDALPALLSGDTRQSSERLADAYAPCAPGTNEGGAEIVYRWDAAPGEDGVLVASVDDVLGDAFDVDVHILDAPSPDACLARDNITASATITGGASYWISVDTWVNGGGNELPAAFELSVHLLPAGGCPDDMARVAAGSIDVCMDRYEAPNVQGALPLVMYTYYEAQSWCARAGKRLCFDDEWTLTCAGTAGWAYPYGDAYDSSGCNTDKTWRLYDQTRLNAWPASASAPGVASLDELLTAARAVSSGAAGAADHIEELYQGEGGGARASCRNSFDVYDLVGNVEEWTRRRDGGSGPDFSGKLEGRYWAEPRTCQSGVTTHGNAFRFYEIGFRCCLDPP